MDFYETFKSDVALAVKSLYDTVRNLQKHLADIERRLAEERKQSESFEQRIAKLKELGNDALTSTRGNYQKFKDSMRKLSGQLGVSQEAIRIFETEIIPRKKAELAAAGQKAGAALYAFWVGKRPLVEKLLTELIDNIVTEYDGFLNSVSLSVQDYFQGNVSSHKSPFNGVMNSDNMGVWPVLSHPRINRNSWRINNKPPAEIAAKPIVNQQNAAKPVSLPEVPQDEPEGEQTPAEGIVLPSEAGSELVEAEPPLNEALGEAVDVALSPKETLQAIDEALATTPKTLLTGIV